MNRQETNRKLLKILEETLEKNPEFRFIQALWCLKITDTRDRFYEESETTLKRIENEKL